ncbi:MAG: M20/M25/M40 family metallo-hydrolase [Bacteroidia bacterium]|nr:M20/M25/M40 family metallo-hydrolase [Bacteroidia bacterium]
MPLLAQNKDSILIGKFFEFEKSKGLSYSLLRSLCKQVGHRLSGSPNAEKAVNWAEAEMQKLQPNRVSKQACMVPHWERGRPEVAVIKSAHQTIPLDVLALGGSVETGKDGIEAEVVMVEDFDQLKKLGKAGIEGKIVFYTVVMDSTVENAFSSYGKAVAYRWKGPAEAARYGAVATIVRSMCTRTDDYPHTGTMRYNDSLPKIPCFAISTLDAGILKKHLEANPKDKLFLFSGCKFFPDSPSYNVIAELTGTEFPNEIITVGGHLDSWDVGEGAHDDGAGVVQSMEIIYLFNQLGIKPKRTIRVVAFMNEENGGRGGKSYVDFGSPGELHLMAIESDEGAGKPLGFGIEGANESFYAKVNSWKKYFIPFGLTHWPHEGGGSDIEHLVEAKKCVSVGFIPDPSKYFYYHHSNTDVFENIDEMDLKNGAASMAAFVWLVSEYGL